MFRGLNNDRGSSTITVLIGVMCLVFIVFPIFGFVIEKYIVFNKGQLIKDSIDITNIAVYNSLNNQNLSKNSTVFSDSEAMDIYKSLLVKNLNLNDDLTPKANSIAEGKVRIESVELYTSGFPVTCPNGKEFVRPSVHSIIVVPIKPSFYRAMVLNALGKEYVELIVHVDSDIPVNN